MRTQYTTSVDIDIKGNPVFVDHVLTPERRDELFAKQGVKMSEDWGLEVDLNTKRIIGWFNTKTKERVKYNG